MEKKQDDYLSHSDSDLDVKDMKMSSHAKLNKGGNIQIVIPSTKTNKFNHTLTRKLNGTDQKKKVLSVTNENGENKLIMNQNQS